MGVNVHRGTDIGVAQQLLHVLGCRSVGEKVTCERVPEHMLATNVFIPYALIPYYGAMPGFAKLPQKKNAAILKKDYNALYIFS